MRIKRWIPLLVTTLVTIAMICGWFWVNPFAFEPLFGKSYDTVFHAYTSTYASTSPAPTICLTTGGEIVDCYFVATQLKEITFNPEAFTALASNPDHWQDFFSPEYICTKVVQAWYGTTPGETSTRIYYLLLLDDNMLLYAEGGYKEDASNAHLYRVRVLKSYATQSDFFKYWYKHAKHSSSYNREKYAFWWKLYYKYR